MTGVDILSTAEVVTQQGFYWPVFVLSAIAGGLIIGIVAWIGEKRLDVTACFAVLGVLAGMLFGVVSAIEIGNKDDVYEIQYKVTVSEEALMSEFLDTYEIVGQDGKILIVRKKSK